MSRPIWDHLDSFEYNLGTVNIVIIPFIETSTKYLCHIPSRSTQQLPFRNEVDSADQQKLWCSFGISSEHELFPYHSFQNDISRRPHVGILFVWTNESHYNSTPFCLCFYAMQLGRPTNHYHVTPWTWNTNLLLKRSANAGQWLSHYVCHGDKKD